MDPPRDRISKGATATQDHPDAGVAGLWTELIPDMVDAFRVKHPSSQGFTHFHGTGAARLDRFYISQNAIPYLTNTDILSRRAAEGSNFLSDHRPIRLRFLHRAPMPMPPATQRQRHAPPPTIRTAFLKDQELRNKWQAHAEVIGSEAPMTNGALLHWWPQAKARLATYARQMHNEYRQKCKDRIDAAEKALEEVQIRIAAGDQSAGVELVPSRAAVRRAIREVEGNLHPDKAWLHHREEPHPGLTARLKPRKEVRCGPSLKDGQGRLHSSAEACAQIMVKHYSTIAAPPQTDLQAQQEILAALEDSPRIAKDQDSAQEVTPAEVKAALRRANPTVAPGIDGFKLVLYKAASATFIPLLAKLFSAIGQLSRMPRGFHQGLVIPLHKKGDRTQPANYRPITLLNTDYRILASILSRRLMIPLSEIIDPVQTAFIRGRTSGENIWFLQLLPHVLHAAGRSALIVFCDFQKAYDTVDRQFLLNIMSRLGAGPGLLRWTSLLLSNTASRALVMGKLSPLVTFHAGVRQGCPLAPLLYLFVGQALLLHLRQQGLGITIPSRPIIEAMGTNSGPSEGPPGVNFQAANCIASYRSQRPEAQWTATAVQYADDFKAMINSPSEVPAFLDAMRTFGNASGQQLSQEKTVILPVGVQREMGSNISGIKVVQEAKALGITFKSYIQPPTANWDEMMTSVQTCYQRIAGVGLSAFGRGIASSAYGVSQFLHAAEFTGLPDRVAERMIRCTTALVDRDELPNSESSGQSFAGIRGDLLTAAPRRGGFGAIPLKEHIRAREAKWGIRLLLAGTTKPWTSLAWALLNQVVPKASPAMLALEHIYFTNQVLSRRDISLNISRLPSPLRRLIAAMESLPSLDRKTVDGPTPDWMPVIALFRWRLLRDPLYINWILSQGTLGWAGTAASRPGAIVPLWSYSVALGTCLLSQNQASARGTRYQTFLGEAGVIVPEEEALACLETNLRRLWKLPIPNDKKEVYWRCFLNALPTAARRHCNDPCGCGDPMLRPDRKHHFGDCQSDTGYLYAGDARGAKIHEGP